MRKNILLLMTCFTISIQAGTQVSPAKATELLNQQNHQLQKKIVQVTSNVYVAVAITEQTVP